MTELPGPSMTGLAFIVVVMAAITVGGCAGPQARRDGAGASDLVGATPWGTVEAPVQTVPTTGTDSVEVRQVLRAQATREARMCGVEEAEGMRIYFRQSGMVPYAPVLIDTRTMPPAEAREIERLVKRAEFFSLPEQPLRDYSIADQVQLDITIAHGKRCHSVSMHASRSPDKLGYLVERLREETQPSDR